MKAIIIAAGEGKRMLPLTKCTPKCMLDFEGKTLLERHLEILSSCGVRDVSVIKGYLTEKINYSGLKYFLNDRFRHNNILNSLFYAERQIEGEVIVSYSDILYPRSVLDKLISSEGNVSIVVDTVWRNAYEGRYAHPIQEAEKVNMSSEKFVLDIGKNIKPNGASDAEFIGMMKLSSEGSKVFKDISKTVKRNYCGKPFHEAEVFEKAYLTDMIQELVDRKIPVSCVTIQGGWREIDTIEDYENARKELKEILQL